METPNFSNTLEQQYLFLLGDILENGEERIDRTGTGTISVFGRHLKIPLKEGFPLLTTKQLHTRSIIHELLMFVRGETDNKYLNANNVTIWDEWAKEDGDLGPIYGYQWRHWRTRDGKEIDQLGNAIEKIKNNPVDRRMVVSAWNPEDIPDMALPPCHMFFQFYVNKNGLSCQMYQRSVDTFLGLPFNIASYAFLTHMVANLADLEVDNLDLALGDTHIYLNHKDQVKEQLSRTPLALPRLELLNKPEKIEDYKYEDIKILDYKYHPRITAQISK